jgi:hypothetical protein
MIIIDHTIPSTIINRLWQPIRIDGTENVASVGLVLFRLLGRRIEDNAGIRLKDEPSKIQKRRHGGTMLHERGTIAVIRLCHRHEQDAT